MKFASILLSIWLKNYVKQLGWLKMKMIIKIVSSQNTEMLSFSLYFTHFGAIGD